MLHNIVEWLAGEGMTLAAAGKEKLVSIDHPGARRGESSGLLKRVKSLLRCLGSVYTRVGRPHHLVLRIGRYEVRVPAKVMIKL